MPFIRFNGWGLPDISNFLANAGERNSYGGYNDANGECEDPTFKFMPSAIDADMAVLKAEFADAITTNDSFKGNAETVSSISTCIVASTLELAKHMTHKSVCVIFGRDMYPMQEAIRIFEHKLRGTWIYIEGASRSITHKNKFRQAIASQFSRIFEKADVIYAVDTGYQGSVPENAILENDFFSEAVRKKTKIRLICYNRTTGTRHLFSRYKKQNQINYFKRLLEEIEGYAKPILRSTQTNEQGLPIINISNRVSILASAVLMDKVREDSIKVLPYFSLMMDKEVDIVQEYWGHLPTFNPNVPDEDDDDEDDYTPVKKETEKIIIALFGPVERPTCTCDMCMSSYYADLNKKLKLLGG